MTGQDDRKKETWIDYMEDEIDPSLKEDYAKVLTHSREDVRLLQDLKSLRNSLKKSDPIEGLGKKTDFNEKLFNQIMGEIEQTSMHPRWRVRYMRPAVLAPIAASVALAVGAVGLLKSVEKPSETAPVVAVQPDTSEWLLQASVNDPEALADTVNDYQSDDDFVLETLAHRMDGMSDSELQDAMQEMLNK